ncbi:MAG: hypothetical protein PWP23_3232 [Candidatus Sumerlaeota bacterium]|nr:hypothetical protein [Candidatus Sumerlaeota bacterium]
MVSPRPFIALALFAVLLLGAVGCSKKPPVVRQVTVAVLNGTMAPGAGETRKSIAGYWLSARDRYDNGEAGVAAAEALAREFAKAPGVSVFSRTDLRAYMAQKERLLARAYPDLTPEQRLDVLESQSPVDYGRSLNVDYVLATEIAQSRTIHHMAFDWWSSRVELEISLWDVGKERVVWAWEGEDTDMFRSQVGVMEDLAEKACKEAVKYDVFRVLEGYGDTGLPPGSP